MQTGLPQLRRDDVESRGEHTLSCAQCRSRKLKCGRQRPVCERCLKLNESCSYPGSRQRAIGRRKTVRELEERIEELERLLQATGLENTRHAEPSLENNGLHGTFPSQLQGQDPFGTDSLPSEQLDLSFLQTPLAEAEPTSVSQAPTGQLIDLGQLEQLPSFELIDKLTDLFFRNVYSGAPILHQASYTAALRLPPHMRPPMCLQYIVMASAAVTDDTYRHLAEPFYQRARVYAEADELKGQGETSTTLAHAQCWCLIAGYECHVYAIFTRSSTSLCRSVRIAQMLKLHQLDAGEADVPYSGLPPARNFVEAEERRRMWWVVFLADRYLTSTTGWPSLINERHIRTNLPSSEESFAAGTEESAVSLSSGLYELEQGRGAYLSPLAIRILAANELLHALDHSAHHSPVDAPDDVHNGPYWRRQRELDRNLSTLTFFLPEKVQLSGNPHSLDAILIHMSTNMATIQLHRTALGLMHRHSLPSYLIAQSQARLLSAADGILGMFRSAGDAGVGVAIRNPLLAFAAYMAASVFLDDFLGAGAVQNRQSEDNLNYLAGILIFFGRSKPLVRAMAFQLATDMKRTGYDSSLMDKMLTQVQTLGGSTSEILESSSKGLPMFFCPALTSTTDPTPADGSGGNPAERSASTLGGPGGFGFHESEDSVTMPLGNDFTSSQIMMSGSDAHLTLQPSTSDGMFSQFGTNLGSCFLP